MRRLAFVIVALSLPALASAAEVRKIDLSAVECEVVAVTAETVTIATDAGEESIPRDDVSEIVFSPESYDPQAGPMGVRGQAVLVTTSGDVVPAAVVELADGTLSFVSSVVGARQVAMARVSAIYMPAGDETAAELADICREMQMGSAASDSLLVSQAEGGHLHVQGALRSIATPDDASAHRKTVTFTWQDADREIPLADVRAILLAGADPDETPLAGRIVGRDGAALGFTSIVLEGEQLTVESPALGTVLVATDFVNAVQFVSPRVVHLTDLTPSAATTHGMVTDAMEPRRNLSVGGGPIRLDGVTYATGLGLHSFTELVYELGGEFTTFAAVVGIDDSVRPNGQATLTLLVNYAYDDEAGRGGGASVLDVTGDSPAETIRFDVSGVTALTITVDFGDDELGVADHVDLAAARLIR